MRSDITDGTGRGMNTAVVYTYEDDDVLVRGTAVLPGAPTPRAIALMGAGLPADCCIAPGALGLPDLAPLDRPIRGIHRIEDVDLTIEEPDPEFLGFGAAEFASRAATVDHEAALDSWLQGVEAMDQPMLSDTAWDARIAEMRVQSAALAERSRGVFTVSPQRAGDIGRAMAAALVDLVGRRASEQATVTRGQSVAF